MFLINFMDTRAVDETVQIREIIDRAMSRLNTCMPGVILSFNSSTQLCTVQPSIQLKVLKDAKVSYIDLPVIINVPIVIPFASTSGYALTLPLQAGDSCLILFSQRAIDHWLANDGVQPPEPGISSRHHHLTDALVFPAPISKPNVLANWNNEGIEIRNTDRSIRIHVGVDSVELVAGTTQIIIDSNGESTLTTGTSLTIDCPSVTLTGNLDVEGTVTADDFIEV